MNTVHWGAKQMLIFAAVNALLIVIVAVFWLVPMIRDIGHLRSHVGLQESQYAARARHYIAYEDNLRELETLRAKPQFMTYNESAAALQAMDQLTERHSLHRLNFTANRSMGFYANRFGQVDEWRISTAGEVADVPGFLYALENTPAHILSMGIVWVEYPRAIINVDMSLISVEE